MQISDIPSWMLEQTDYRPQSDHDGFITKSILKLMSLMAQIRDGRSIQANGAGAAMKLIAVLVFIVLSAVSRNMFFTLCLIAGLLVCMVPAPGKAVSRVLKNAAVIALLTALILLPAAFAGFPRTLFTVSLKVFLSVGLITWMSATTPWNQITEALSVFHIPDLLIFILDLALKYIAVLGEICCDMLISLEMRSVGRNRRKGHSLSGIPGVAFLKSRQMADDMYEAMICRGFSGEYVRRRKKLFGKRDLPLFLTLVSAIIFFAYSQSVI